MTAWRHLRASVCADITTLCEHSPSKLEIVAALSTNRGTQALLVYRISHLLWRKRIPVIPAVLTRVIQILYCMDISYRAEIGPGCAIFHGFGLVIASYVRVGRDAVFFHGVTLGTRSFSRTFDYKVDGLPTLGDHVFVGAGAKILGAVQIGDYAAIGANAVVTKSVPAGYSAVGVPAVVRPRPSVQRYVVAPRPPGETST